MKLAPSQEFCIAEVLHRFGYKRLKKPDKGLILRYLERTTDYSRQQLTRIVKRWRTGKKLVPLLDFEWVVAHGGVSRG